MRHRKRVRSAFEPRFLRDSQAEFLEQFGPTWYARRANAIAELPRIDWKGQTLFTIRCHGDFGNGPHDVNVPESLLWNLTNLDRFRCAYHRP